MSTLTHSIFHDQTTAERQPVKLVHSVRASRSLASMLPALLSSGVMTLVITAVMHLMWSGLIDGFVGVWMESWLTAWPIAFPVAYLSGPLLGRLAAMISAPAARRTGGLACGDIADASERVTAQNGLLVRRNLKPAHDYSGA